MLTFSVATNWDDNLIREIEALSQGYKVTEIFGKLDSDFIGGGRPAYSLPSVRKKDASNHIKLVKKTGREFNYLLNASCLDNKEFTRSGQKSIKKLLTWLDCLGVNVITIANPYIGYLIKKEYPQFKLTVSAFASLDSVRKIKFWTDEIGADKVTLNSHRINRNFQLLKKIRSETSCKLQLLANELCLLDCPLAAYHVNFVSHASQSHHPLRGFGIDWCLMQCRRRLLTQPGELIKVGWIRPEDIDYYDEIGIDSLKIVDRTRDTQGIITSLKSYLLKKHDRNLMDLLVSINKSPKRKVFFRALKFFFHPLYINIFKLKKFKQLLSDVEIYIDNQKLDGFINYFLEGKCDLDNCDKCDYCNTVAEKAVYIDAMHRNQIEKRFEEAIKSVTQGDIFRYF